MRITTSSIPISSASLFSGFYYHDSSSREMQTNIVAPLNFSSGSSDHRSLLNVYHVDSKDTSLSNNAEVFAQSLNNSLRELIQREA